MGVMPDEFCRLTEVLADGVEGIVIAVAAGKNDDTKFHGLCFWGGTSSLPEEVEAAGAASLRRPDRNGAWRSGPDTGPLLTKPTTPFPAPRTASGNPASAA